MVASLKSKEELKGERRKINEMSVTNSDFVRTSNLKKKGTEWMFSVGGADNVLHSCLTSRQRDSRWLLKKERNNVLELKQPL